MDSDDDGNHDAYLNRVKREGKAREQVDDDDDESTDEDYMLPDDFSEVEEE